MKSYVASKLNFLPNIFYLSALVVIQVVGATIEDAKPARAAEPIEGHWHRATTQSHLYHLLVLAYLEEQQSDQVRRYALSPGR